MLDEDPVIIVYDLIRNNWNNANTPLGSDPKFSTGWYDYGSSDPQITVTDSEEGVVQGGITGHSASTGDGGVAQYRNGILLVNCWGGSYDDLTGAGPNGEDVSPKDAAYQMANEVHRIMQDNASGTSDSNGNKQLHSLGADATRRIVEEEADPSIFRHEVTVLYTYLDKNPGPS